MLTNRPLQLVTRLLSGVEAQISPITITEEEWGRIVDIAETGHVAPLLFNRLKASGFEEQIPAHIFRKLASLYYASSAQNIILFHELDRVLGVLSEAQISVITLKGAALAHTLYPDPALRPMGDLDLLIHPADLQASLDILKKSGYLPRDLPKLSSSLDRLLGYDVRLFGGPQGKVILELHWNLVANKFQLFKIPLDWFWEQAEPYPLSQFRPGIYQLVPNALLVYQSIHLMMKHGIAEAPLLWFYDLHLLLTKENERIHWSSLFQIAEENGWLVVLGKSLLETSRLFHSNLPAEVQERLHTLSEAKISEVIERKAEMPVTQSSNVWKKIQILGWRERLFVVWSVVFPEVQYMRWRYQIHSNWLLPYSYLKRWWNILTDVQHTLLHK